MKVKRTIKMKVNHFEVGDVIKFKLTTGEKVEAMAMKQDGDNMIFCFVDCLEKEYAMGSNCYENSKIRAFLNNDVLKSFPCSIYSRMVAFDNGDWLRIPTEKEIFGENKYGEEEDNNVKQWKPMKKRKNRIASQGLNGCWEWYFLQNKVEESASHFCYVSNYGNAYYNSASNSNGVRPSFQLKNN